MRMRKIRGWSVALGLIATVLAPAAQASALIEIADRCTLPLRVRAASPIGTGGCSGVRPGAFFSSPVAGCTFNFLFRGTDGYRYMGTAGHCLVAQDEVASWPIGAGPEIRSDAGALVGRGAYAINKENRDFALIRLDHSARANAQMCHFGGPTGLDDSHSSAPATLEHYGQGAGVSNVAPGRTAVAANTTGENAVIAMGVAIPGDSGSGVTRSGRALGVLVALVIGVTPGNIYITRLIPQLEEAEQAIGTDLTLVTAARL